MADETSHPATPAPLSFDTDAGSRRAGWIAAAILLVIVGWMGSGFVLPAGEETVARPAEQAPQPVSVAVAQSQAEDITLFFQAEGQAQPDRDTALRIEASGDVAEVLIGKGEDVAQGQTLVRLDTTRLEADLERAREDLARARRESDNAQDLLERGVATGDRVADARAALAAAQAAVAAAEESLDSARLFAPFDGRIETLSLDIGEFVSAGSEVGRIVDIHPLTVSLRVPQQALGLIENGQPATVSFITGETRQGAVTFVGTAAEAATRTFLAEISVDNRDGAIPAGISAEIVIPVGESRAHFISPSLVSLGPDGETGVKAVVDDRVVFYPVELARAEVDGIWVTGIPDTATLITVGQGFVRPGETVRAIAEDETGEAASDGTTPDATASDQPPSDPAAGSDR